MKVLMTWQVHEGKLHETLGLFSQMTAKEEKALMGKNVKLISRWHDLLRGSGVAVFETDSVEALSAYSLNWNRFMDLDVSVVLDDAQTKAIGKQMVTG